MASQERLDAVNLEQGYGLIEIRTPKEVLSVEKDF
jgi:hypothetical protein